MQKSTERVRKWRQIHPGMDAKDVYNRRKLRRKALIENRGGKCIRCGYNRCLSALEFHHIDPSTKLFELVQRHMTKPWDLLIVEAQKCELLCANCHRELHYLANE